MKISIITISYNQAQFLEGCICSVLSQEGDFEYIVIDGGSDDGSREVIEKYSDQISYWVSERDNGPLDALNKGFALATGEVCCYLNSDDRLAPRALKKIRTAFKENPDIDVIYANGNIIDSSGNIVGVNISSKHFLEYRYLLETTMVCQPSTFFRLETFRKTDGFSIENRTCWDGELLLRMCQNGANFKYIPVILSDFRIHDGSITGSGRMKDEYHMYRKTLFERTLKRHKRKIESLISYLYRLQEFMHRRIQRARLKLFSAQHRYPGNPKP